MRIFLSIVAAALLPLTATACIWDAQTLFHEKLRSHDLAQTILGTAPPVPEDQAKLRAIIKDLEAHRRETDADWWNNLAGSYIRLGEPKKAVELLEPIVSKFPNDYGIHANLGTAFHLLGRYADAEKEIARDLEINPNAHFGLEKYHLALLQYLVRDPKYQSRHVYVDELTAPFLYNTWGGRFQSSDSIGEIFNAMAQDYTNNVAAAEADYESLLKTNERNYELSEMLGTVAAVDPPPAYRKNWNLGADTNLEAGVIYMAQMNPKEPACWTMLGIVAWKKGAYHLAASAFETAVRLGSPQSDLLTKRVTALNEYISKSRMNASAPLVSTLVFSLIPIVILYYIYSKIRDYVRSRRLVSP